MENKRINEKILNVWKNYPEESGEYHPILYPIFKKGGILFIGLNPSSSEKTFKKVFKGTKVNMEEKLNRDSKDICFLIGEGKKVYKEDTCDYFNKFRDISKKSGSDFQHIDLFFFRLTKQKEAKEKIEIECKKKGDTFNFNDFGEKQLEIANEMISEISPEVIVVGNALASAIINNYDLFKINDKTFEKEGYDILEIKNKKIPIIFSSMLTGQRALDNHSLRRLIWQIKRVINK